MVHPRCRGLGRAGRDRHRSRRHAPLPNAVWFCRPRTSAGWTRMGSGSSR